MNTANAPPGTGRLFYAVDYRDDGTADVYLMPFEGVKMVVRGVDPWDGMEEDIRARFYAWCDSAEVIAPEMALRTIHHGDSGLSVVVAKLLTGTISAVLEDADNGRFDADFVAHVCAWQRLHGLTPDGVIGPLTWAALFQSTNQRGDYMGLIAWLKERLIKPELEPEYEEAVEHDTVMVMVDGKLVEVTSDDAEKGR